MGITRRGVSARGGVAMSRSGAETSACSASLTSAFVSTSGWAGLSADAEVEKTKVNKQRTGAARVIWWAFMVFPPACKTPRARLLESITTFGIPERRRVDTVLLHLQVQGLVVGIDAAPFRNAERRDGF